MRSSPRTNALVVVLGSIALLTVMLPAAPILPTRRNLPDEIRCLVGIDRVRLEIAPISAQMRGVGVSQEKINGIIRKGITGSDIRIVSDEDAPMLSVTLWPMHTPDLPKVFAVVVMIDIQQRVALLRRDGDKMTLPTTSIMARNIGRMRQRGRILEDSCRTAVQLLVTTLRQADIDARADLNAKAGG